MAGSSLFCAGQPKANDIKRKRNHKPLTAYLPRFMLRGNVLNEERRRAIIEILDHDGRVLVTDMARKFDTSQVTIRKDLEVLHAHGLVHRTHGGALPAREGALEDPALPGEGEAASRGKAADCGLRRGPGQGRPSRCDSSKFGRRSLS